MQLNPSDPDQHIRRPEIAGSRVVLPAPFEPIRQTISFSPTSSDTSHSTWTGAYPAATPSSRSINHLLQFQAALGIALAEIGLDHARIAGDLLPRPTANQLAVVNHDHLVAHRHHQLDPT